MVRLPRLMISAPGSGHGKTTVATGLMAALRAEGLAVAGFKVGPDFIDPGYHALATGRAGRNLDPVLCGADRLAPLLVHGAVAPEPADIAVVEGVMGLFDGQLGGAGFASTAHLATKLATPVVLVVDISAVARTAAAIVHGLHTYDPEVRLSGVILNKAGSPRHAVEVCSELQSTGLPVLGVLPRDAGIELPARHLGLVTAAEQPAAAETVRRLGAAVAQHLDLSRLLALAHTAPDLAAEPWDPAAELASARPASVPRPTSPESGRKLQLSESESCSLRPVAGEGGGAGTARPVVAVAGGRAFTFRYAETDELLRAAGCEPVEFDPLTDPALPPGTAGLYLGGGFPEVHAAELSANTALRADIAGAIAAGVPTVAECAGVLYLCRSVDGTPMVGVVPGDATMTGGLTLGYRTGVAEHDHLLGLAGSRVHGHEFHRTVIAGLDPHECGWLLAIPGPAPASDRAAATARTTSRAFGSLRAGSNTREVTRTSAKWDVESGTRDRRPASDPGDPRVETDLNRPDGFATADLHASYLHVHWAGHPELARRFTDAVRSFAERGVRWEPGPVAVRHPEPDLAHHGDAELADDLVDLAVNVRLSRPPRWLAETIAATVDGLAHYPDPARATAAIAAAHPCPTPSPESGRKLQLSDPESCSLRPLSGEGDPQHVLPTAGAAEAFTLIARAFQPRHAVVVHPQFTEPEAALRAAGHRVRRLLLRPETGFRLDPDQVPPEADLVVIGNPTNPTSVLHPRETVRALLRPGRLLVVDEAFMDAVPGEPATLLDGGSLDGVVVVRSLTKTWGVAGLRAGYVVGDPAAIGALRTQQPPWSVSTPALAVIEAALTPNARESAAAGAVELTGARQSLVDGLTELGLAVTPNPSGPYVLVDAHRWEIGHPPGWLRTALRERGFAVRRCDTFPGLDAGWLRIAVREPAVTETLLRILRAIRGVDGSTS